jgi:ubiquinone/menaquinone biosynthesis C-methylase UbiE
MSDKMYFYERFAEEFDSKMNMYDTNKRLHVFYNELLTEEIKDKKLLDAGCGTGWFSKWACDRKADVTSMDLGEGLLKRVALKCDSTRVVGSILEIPFEDNSFDIVVSSEVIEHTPDPKKALKELYRVLKPGGTLVLSVPNKFWYFSIWIANKLNLRPYDGYEKWLGWFELKKSLKAFGFEIKKMQGIHLFPFIFSFLNPVLDFFHRFNKPLGPVMLNIAVKCHKPAN